jgi:3-hydroxyacyl-CoA dehydrogenase/enoyl-CoA hydratase/3-hydroxybutyryl-CoA epimerase
LRHGPARALQFINQYGVKDFVARAQYLAEQYGERFATGTAAGESRKGEVFR